MKIFILLVLGYFIVTTNCSYSQSKDMDKAHDFILKQSYNEANILLQKFYNEEVVGNKSTNNKPTNLGNVYKNTVLKDAVVNTVENKAAENNELEKEQSLCIYYFFKCIIYLKSPDLKNLDSAYSNSKLIQPQMHKLNSIKEKELEKLCKKYLLCFDSVNSLTQIVEKELYQYYSSEMSLEKVRKFIKAYPSSKYYKDALNLEEKIVAELALKSVNPDDWSFFLSKYQTSPYAAAIEEKQFKHYCLSESTNLEKIRYFIKTYPNSKHINEAIKVEEQVITDIVLKSENPDDWSYFLNKYPSSPYFNTVEEKQFKHYCQNEDYHLVSFYITNFPNSSYIEEAKKIETKIYSQVNDDLEKTTNDDLSKVITEELTLVDNFDADGSPILIFENAAGEVIQIESFDDNIINSFMEEDDYGIYYVKEKYLTKSFLVTYETKLIVSAEATENGEEGYIGKHIIKMELKK